MTSAIRRQLFIQESTPFIAEAIGPQQIASHIERAFISIQSYPSSLIRDQRLNDLKNTYRAELNNKQMALRLVRANGVMLKIISEKLRHHKDIVIAAIEDNEEAIDEIPQDLEDHPMIKRTIRKKLDLEDEIFGDYKISNSQRFTWLCSCFFSWHKVKSD